MNIQRRISMFLIVGSILIVRIDTFDPITEIVSQMEVLMKTAKVVNNIMELLQNYPPIFVEYFLAAFDNNKPVPPRSYDFIVDLTRPTDIFENLKAYPISFPLGKSVYDQKLNEKLDRFVVNVVGRYNVGKTYVLRLLANINLGYSFTERTIGVSVSLPSPQDTNGIPLALIDTAGTRTPVAYESETFKDKSYQRQVSDSFIQEIAFNSANIFVLVVNQLTLDDQLYLKTLTKRLKDKGLKDGEIKQQLLLVHNYFNLNTIDEVKRVEETELKGLFNATKNPQGFWLSDHFKHFVLMNNDNPAGKTYNTESIENIRTMIKGAPAERNPDVLKTIVKQVESLLSEFLIVQKPDKPSEETTTTLWDRAIKAVFGSDKKKLEVSIKQQVKVKLEVKKLDMQAMNTLWFMCPIEPLPNNVILSNDLRFNNDGSVYVDFSSQFVPDLNIVPLNIKGDIGINIECPSCRHVTVKQQSMTSILVEGEKMAEPSGEPYFNTRRAGKFEVEVSLNGLEPGLIPNILGLKKQFVDGVFRITIPAQKTTYQLGDDELAEEL